MTDSPSEPGTQTATGRGQSSSRIERSGAGWHCGEPGTYRTAMSKRDVPFSWLNPLPLWRSRNDRLSRWFGDPTNDRRRAWVAELDANDSDYIIEHPADRISFMVFGDSG